MTLTRTLHAPTCTHRPAALPAPPSEIPEELLEEVRQLRASLAVYRKIVERLMERESAG
jgi:hypothetical protein